MTKNDSPIMKEIKAGRFYVGSIVYQYNNKKKDLRFDNHSNSWIVYDKKSGEIIVDTKDEARAVAVLLGEKP